MKLKSFLLFILLSVVFYQTSYAQEWKDTLYFNHNWKSCVKDSAEYYRLVKKVDTLFQLADYYLDGKLQMTGASTTYGDSLYRVGEYKYYKKGVLTSKSYYVDNQLQGELIKYFENGSVYSTQNYDHGKEDGAFYYYYPDNKIRRYENYVDGDLITKKCYTRKGKDTTYYAATRWPVFNKGKQTIPEYLSDNVKYPREAEKKGISGVVNVRFTVEKDGHVADVYTKDEIDELLKQEALRVVSAMPNWTPGANDDVVVRVKYTVKITFKLPE